MCGICGLVTRSRSLEQIRAITERMVELIRHRGPDDSGVWAEGEVGLGHARLSIIDLSPLGRQPMASPSKRWTVCYNGEVYNFGALREELMELGLPFKGGSDTEVIAAALDAWGFESTIKRLRGMFALAARNHRNHQLHLARDRLGQKPLFYGFCEDAFVFGSELRVLRAFSSRPPVDPDSAAMMLRYACVPAPQTIYQGIWKLPPASYIVFNEETRALGDPHCYWRPPIDQSAPVPPTLEGALTRLGESVQLRMVSDVPIGAFLSGGVDSTIITAMMQKISSTPIRSFTIGFDDPRYNEADHARKIASYLGTDHTELRFREEQALNIVPRLGEIYDEPFADPSQVPTVLLCQLTRQHVTVALSGDGGDELFQGYNRSVWLPLLHRVFRVLPGSLCRGLGTALRSQSSKSAVGFLADAGILKTRLVHDKLKKLANLLEVDSFRARYRALLSDWVCSTHLVRGANRDQLDEFRGATSKLSLEDQVTLADFLFYLPDDILVKVDRASMSVGLEARAPFLDHQLVEYCSGFAVQQNIRGRQGKCVLREMLAQMVPKELFDRPKMGFAAPIRDWLRGKLKEWAWSQLSSAWVKDQELLVSAPILSAWKALQEGHADTSHRLWNVLMLVSWLEADKNA